MRKVRLLSPPHPPTNPGSTVRPVSIVDKKHYVNLARLRALEFGSPTRLTSSPSLLLSQSTPSSIALDPTRGLFADQFENLSNAAAHEESTAPEIWRQTNGNVDAFVSGAGTGGTIAGVGKYLKGKKESVEIVLADCQGSGLFHKVSLSSHMS